MEIRTLGRTGIEVPFMGFGGIPMMRCSDAEGIALYRYAIDQGIRYFDAARGYTDCEPRLGAAVKGQRDRVVIASKAGQRDAEGMMTAIDESLQRLDTDYIDIYKLHGVCQFDDLEKAMGPGGAVEGLQKAKEQGKLRHTGISGHNSDVLIRAVETGLFDVILVIFNYMNTEPAAALLPRCAELGVGVTVMKPLGGSTLTQHSDLALRWVLQHEQVGVVCPGMWRRWEIDTNVRIAEQFAPLNATETAVIADQQRMRSESFCRLCYRHHHCPKGVELDDLMIADLNYTRFGLEMMVSRGWDKRVEATAQCFECEVAEECRTSCNHGVDIPRYMRHVYTTYMPIIEEYRRIAQSA